MLKRSTARARPGLLGAIIVACFLSGGCGKHGDDDWKDAKSGQKRILAVTPALACFARNVGGDNAHVLCLLSHTGPHDYEPTPADVVKAKNAELFLANGLDLDDFVARIASRSGNRKLEIFKAAEHLPHAALLHPEHGHDHGHGHDDHSHGAHDPHVWLSPAHAKMLSQIVAAKLSKLDPANASAYAKRSEAYGKALDALLAEGKAMLAGKKNRRVIAMHDSMAYFAEAFGIDVAGIIQPKAAREADGARIAEIVTLCEKKHIGAICFEPQFAKTAAETLQKSLKSRGVDVRLVEFDPLETLAPGEQLDEDFYIRRMRKNLSNLAEGLP